MEEIFTRGGKKKAISASNEDILYYPSFYRDDHIKLYYRESPELSLSFTSDLCLYNNVAMEVCETGRKPS